MAGRNDSVQESSGPRAVGSLAVHRTAPLAVSLATTFIPLFTQEPAAPSVSRWRTVTTVDPAIAGEDFMTPSTWGVPAPVSGSSTTEAAVHLAPTCGVLIWPA